MKKYDHLRVLARKLRLAGLSIDEICERVSLGKGTVYHWIKNIPLQRKSRSGYNLGKGAAAKNSLRYKELREKAYQKGVSEFSELLLSPTFRDFVVLYLTEGFRRTKNTVSISNSNPKLVQLAYYWLKRLANPDRALSFPIQTHIDQNIFDLVQFWSSLLQVSPDLIHLQRKSNSGNLNGRVWRSKYGVLTVRVSDTYLRCRLEAWMDLLQESWTFGVWAQGGPPDLGSGHQVSSILTTPTNGKGE